MINKLLTTVSHNQVWDIQWKSKNSSISWVELVNFQKYLDNLNIASVQFSRSVVSMNHSMPSLPVHHQLPEFTQTHVRRVGDAIQPSHPLSSPSPPAPNPNPASGSFPMSQFFASGGQSTGVSASASVLPMNTQDWSHLGWTGWIPLQSKGLSTVFFNTTVQKHQFFGAQLSSQSYSHIHTWPLEEPQPWLTFTFSSNWLR